MAQQDPSQFSKTWELSPYELHRKPQELITDNSDIAVSPRSLHSELMCPICLDMLKNTMTTKECLHRFCQECIITALRSGNKECPTCRKKLISKRSLRPDPNFDMLISKIYPSRDEYEAQQERVIAKVNKQTFVHNIEETLRLQTLNRTRAKRNNDDDASRKKDFVSPSDNKELLENNESEEIVHEIELIIKPLPQVERSDPILSQTRFIKTSMGATIGHIAKYLAIRYRCESEMTEEQNISNDAENPVSNCLFPFTIYIAAGPGQYNPIPGSATLEQVDEQYWKVNRPLEIYYAYKVNPSS